MNDNIKLKKRSRYIMIISFILGMICVVTFGGIENDNPLFVPIILISTALLLCSFISFIIFVALSLQIRATRKQNLHNSKNISTQNQSSYLSPSSQTKLDKNAEYWRNRNRIADKIPKTIHIAPVNKQINIAKLNIHEEIKDLIFYSEYKPIEKLNNLIFADPSFIDESLPVVEYNYHVTVEKLNYYPSYRNMTPIQRGKYLKFLENPYDDTYEIGYVFTLFYGLEHHLILGNKSPAAFVINKLRQYHNNNSFQSYSFDALLYFFALRDEMLKFLEYEYDELNFEYSILYHILTDGIYPSNLVMTHKKAFGLKKDAYINRDPILFQYELNNQLFKKYNISGIPLSSYFSIDNQTLPYFSFPANLLLKSIVKESPTKGIFFNNSNNVNYEPFKYDINVILNETYDIVTEIHKHKFK